jgi:hypothetical protein
MKPKTKNFKKKLTLNKKTVANLEGNEMNVINGGVEQTVTCYQCDTRQSCEATRCYYCFSFRPQTYCFMCDPPNYTEGPEVCNPFETEYFLVC